MSFWPIECLSSEVDRPVTDEDVANSEAMDDSQKVLHGLIGVKPLDQNSSGRLVSNRYNHECKYRSCPSRWAEFDNVEDEGQDLVARTKAVPIIHRHQYVSKHWVTQSITVQDETMRQVLRIALANTRI